MLRSSSHLLAKQLWVLAACSVLAVFSLPCCAVKSPKEEAFLFIVGVSEICIHALNASWLSGSGGKGNA